MRSFHATRDAGGDCCPSLGYDDAQVEVRFLMISIIIVKIFFFFLFSFTLMFPISGCLDQ